MDGTWISSLKKEYRMQKIATTVTEIAMLLYWVLAGVLALDLIKIDPALMYSDYQNPRVVAWNWSFFPIDVAFAISGLAARFWITSGSLRYKLEITAAVLMICAGGMAISYWSITGEFDLTWWAMNIWLFSLGVVNLTSARPND